MKLAANYLELKGTNYEIGQKLGRIIAGIGLRKAFHTSGWHQFEENDARSARELFGRWCPGLNEELQGFADALGIRPEQATYYVMTYLKPRCSQVVILPGLSADGHVRLARSYEYSHEAEDFTLARTSVAGKYTHLGTSVMLMGRDEGMNECGLAVSMSSCGFPVGAYETMRNPALRGLQFWAVIRTLLENCRDVGEALSFLNGMPIAYNINLLLADKAGHAALVETLDGRKAVKPSDNQGVVQYLHATNHVVLPELRQYESKAMRNSFHRYEYLRKFLDQAGKINPAQLKMLLLSKYPDGLCCHFYADYMGTTKSLLMDLNLGQVDICWGGLESNGWQSFRVLHPLEDHQQPIQITGERAQPAFFEFIDY